MGWGKAALFALLAIAASPAALAQEEPSCPAAEAEARDITFDDVRPFAAATTTPGLSVRLGGGDCRILTLYIVQPRVAVPAGAQPADVRREQKKYSGQLTPVRLIARYVDDLDARKWKPRWADERSCPALRPAIKQLDAILAPNFTGDRPYRALEGGATDRPIYRFSSLGSHGPPFDIDHDLQIDLQSPPDAPFGRWFETTLKSLDACWSSLEPKP